MPIFEKFIRKRTRWVEFETVYTLEHMDSICLRLTEEHIPHKVRAALLPVGIALAFPAAALSLWYLSVPEEDVPRARQFIRAVMEEKP
ncbi:hypothetical protein [Gemmiger sp.]